MNTYKLIFLQAPSEMIILEGITIVTVIAKLNENNVTNHDNYILLQEKDDAFDVQLNNTAKDRILNVKQVRSTWSEKDI